MMFATAPPPAISVRMRKGVAAPWCPSASHVSACIFALFVSANQCLAWAVSYNVKSNFALSDEIDNWSIANTVLAPPDPVRPKKRAAFHLGTMGYDRDVAWRI